MRCIPLGSEPIHFFLNVEWMASGCQGHLLNLPLIVLHTPSFLNTPREESCNQSHCHLQPTNSKLLGQLHNPLIPTYENKWIFFLGSIISKNHWWNTIKWDDYWTNSHHFLHPCGNYFRVFIPLSNSFPYLGSHICYVFEWISTWCTILQLVLIHEIVPNNGTTNFIKAGT